MYVPASLRYPSNALQTCLDLWLSMFSLMKQLPQWNTEFGGDLYPCSQTTVTQIWLQNKLSLWSLWGEVVFFFFFPIRIAERKSCLGNTGIPCVFQHTVEAGCVIGRMLNSSSLLAVWPQRLRRWVTVSGDFASTCSSANRKRNWRLVGERKRSERTQNLSQKKVKPGVAFSTTKGPETDWRG